MLGPDFTLVCLNEYHWHVRDADSGTVYAQLWPDSNKYLGAGAVPGQKARVGSVENVAELCRRMRRDRINRSENKPKSDANSFTHSENFKPLRWKGPDHPPAHRTVINSPDAVSIISNGGEAEFRIEGIERIVTFKGVYFSAEKADDAFQTVNDMLLKCDVGHKSSCSKGPAITAMKAGSSPPVTGSYSVDAKSLDHVRHLLRLAAERLRQSGDKIDIAIAEQLAAVQT